MPAEIINNDDSTIYRITRAEWICEWSISKLYNQSIKRSLHLTYDIDPLDKDNSDKLLKMMPGLFQDIQNTVNNWILEGHQDAKLLLLLENKPSLLLYAEQVMFDIKNNI